MKIEKSQAGFTYHFEVIEDGEVVAQATCKNLIPTQGFDHTLNVLLNAAAQYTTWYVGLYTNAYTPLATDTAATFIGDAGEITEYVSSTRVPLRTAPAAGGSASNVLNKAEFEITGTAAVTVRGGFISSSSVKGGTSGVLLSAVRASNSSGAPIEFLLQPGSVLRVTAGITFEAA